jgi:hypothetical protein
MNYCRQIVWQSKVQFVKTISIGYVYAFFADLATLIDGTSDPEIIATNFARHFAAVCSPFSSKFNEEFKVKFNEKSQCFDGSPLVENDLFSVELIDGRLYCI